ncbi:MAG TPA: hypothetical protein VIK48_02205, partial [Candidatus Manganitrophaceae bacterium]
GLSANLSYYLIRSPRFQMPLGYVQQTQFYYRVQSYFSSHGFSLGFRHRFLPSISYEFEGRFQTGFAKIGGLVLLLGEGSAALHYAGAFPTQASMEFSYADTSFTNRSTQNTQESRLTLSLSQRLGLQEGDFSLALIDHQTPFSRDNSYQGQQANLGYRYWIRPDLQFQGSGGIFFQNFLYPDTRLGRKRENTLLSYSVGFLYPWSSSATVTVNYRWQRNQSSLGPTVLDQLDILLGRSAALGDYTKRVVSLGVNIAF